MTSPRQNWDQKAKTMRGAASVAVIDWAVVGVV